MSNQGHNLIFLISQPRSGSTLTQRILGAHSQIHTQSEPWIMLHPLNALKSNNIHTSYDMDLYINGAFDFINHLPGKERYYEKTISEAYQKLYDSILKKEKKSLFLDKTPRYYYIIKELADYFPNAKFIFLWRNPAAVLTSIIQTWSKADWYRLSEWKDDLLIAPQLMLKGIEKLKDNCFVLRYEDLLKQPDVLVKKVFSFLTVPFEEKVIEYGHFNVSKWQYGDQVTVNKNTRPDGSRAKFWLTHLNNPQIWRVVSDYVNYLGSDLISLMGYDFEEIENLMAENKPSSDISTHTLPLSDLLNTNRSILIENMRLQKDLKNATAGLKAKDESLKMRNEVISLKDKLLGDKEKYLQQSKVEVSKIQEILKEKRLLVNKQLSTISQREKQLEQCAKELESLTKTMSEKDHVIEKRNNEITILKLSLQEKESHIQQMFSDIGSLKLSLKEKESDVEELGSKVASLELSLRNKEIQVKESDAKIRAQETKLDLAKTTTEKLQSQTTALHDKLRSALESKQHLNGTIHGQQKQITMLKELIKGIERSYTFRIGKVVIWPFKLIAGRK